MELSEFLARHGKTVERAGGRHVFRQGDDDRCIYLLQEGLLKAYYLSDEGRETIKSFILPGETIASLSSAWRKATCSFNLVCLEPSRLVGVDFAAVYSAARQDLETASAVIDLLLEFAMKKERREREFLTESAAVRYARLVDRAPDIVGRLKQKDIARYLGITPVALSRIRGRRG